MFKSAFLLAIVGLSTSLALAANVEKTKKIEEELVITANRLEQIQGTTLAATSLIDEAEIRGSMATNLYELLSGKPGVQFARNGGQGGQTSLFLRGSESDHTLILIDGVKVNTASEGFARLEYVPIDQIARVEVVRGPRSSLYGSEAIGGVVQIFTKKAGQDRFAGNIVLGAGTEETRKASLSLSGTLENTSYTLNYVHDQTDGIDASQSPFSSDDRDGAENDSFSVSLTHSFNSDTRFKASYLQTDSESDFDDGIGDSISRQVNLSADVAILKNWQSTFSASYFEDDNDNMSSFGATQSTTERVSLNWQNNFRFSATSTLAIGLDYQDEELVYESASSLQTETKRDNFGLYGVYVGTLNPVDYTVSLRQDDNEQFGRHTTGSVAIGTAITDSIQVWASYGTAYKAPNLVDLYVDFPAFFFFANPDLEPETSENFEIGIEANIPTMRWAVNVFNNQIEDLITTDANFTSLTNIGEAQIRGLEASLTTELMDWVIDVSFTLLDHENEDTGEKLQRRPDETFNLSVSRKFGKFDLALNWLVQSDHDDLDPATFGRSVVSGYGIVDLKGAYQVTPDLKLKLKVGNIFNEEYEVIDGFNTYGTTALVTADYSF